MRTSHGLLLAQYWNNRMGMEPCRNLPLSHPTDTHILDALTLSPVAHPQVVDALLALSQPGGVHERTLLLIFGDHGQTMGGDHGGGSSEEVDSALVAVDIGVLHTLRAERASHGAAESSVGNGVENGVLNAKGGISEEEFIAPVPVMAQVGVLCIECRQRFVLECLISNLRHLEFECHAREESSAAHR